MDTALKRHGWLRDANGFISLEAILKYRHGSLPQKSKLSRELAKQAVITKCRGISMRSQAVPLKKPWISVPKIIICVNL